MRKNHFIIIFRLQGIKVFCLGVSKKPMFDATQQKLLASSPSAIHVLSLTYPSLSQMPTMLERMLQGGNHLFCFKYKTTDFFVFSFDTVVCTSFFCKNSIIDNVQETVETSKNCSFLLVCCKLSLIIFKEKHHPFCFRS